MFTTFKTAAAVATAVIAAHAFIGTQAASSLQKQADVAMLPVVKAERIEVSPMRVVKAEKIVVSGKALQIVKADKITVTASRVAKVAASPAV